jgi:hypothetical protein
MPAVQKKIEALLTEALAQRDSRAMQLASNEARLLMTLHVRLLEALVHGEPKTELPKTHHA